METICIAQIQMVYIYNVNCHPSLVSSHHSLLSRALLHGGKMSKMIMMSAEELVILYPPENIEDMIDND